MKPCSKFEKILVELDIKLNMIICPNMEKLRKIIYINNYQCLIINKDTLMNQQSTIEKILSRT